MLMYMNVHVQQVGSQGLLINIQDTTLSPMTKGLFNNGEAN